MSDAGRTAVVVEARSWIGTPYHHAADVKGRNGGVDCAMLLVRTYCDLALVEKFDPRPYTGDWFLHRNEERYLGFLLERSREVRTPLEGDIVIFRFGRCFAHAGIVSKADPLTIIHAYSQVGRVAEDIVGSNPQLASRLKTARFASYWG